MLRLSSALLVFLLVSLVLLHGSVDGRKTYGSMECKQAGGRCTDVRGDARIDTGDVISTNGLLHDDVVAAFART